MQKTDPTSSHWNPWPASIIGFFTIAIISCGTFVTFCSRHPADLVAADYYEQEVRYQGQIDRLQHAQGSSEPAAVTYNDASKLISVSLATSLSQGKPSGTIQLYRPSATSLDRQLKLATDDKGLQIIDASSLVPGLWKVRISWTVAGTEFFVDQKIVVGAKSS